MKKEIKKDGDRMPLLKNSSSQAPGHTFASNINISHPMSLSCERFEKLINQNVYIV